MVNTRVVINFMVIIEIIFFEINEVFVSEQRKKYRERKEMKRFKKKNIPRP